MKINIKTIHLSLLCFVVLNCACKKDPAGPPASNGTTLDHVEYTENISGTVSAVLHYHYNVSGDLTSISSASGSDTIIYKSPGQIMEYRAGNLWSATMLYDANGRVAKSTMISQSIPFLITIFTYDNNGRVIADSTVSDTGSVFKYRSYTYDNNDNMTTYQEFNRYNGDPYVTNGPVIVSYDHHPNPNALFGKSIYFGDGDFRFLFKENSISEMQGGVDQRNPSDLVYEYYSNGLLWKATSKLANSKKIYYYKKP